MILPMGSITYGDIAQSQSLQWNTYGDLAQSQSAITSHIVTANQVCFHIWW